MAFKPYNFKLNSENPAEAALIERIERAENKSSLFKAALYHYFEMPPPPPPALPDAPAPTSGLSAKEMEDALFNALKRAKEQLGLQMTVGGGQEKAPLNERKEGKPKKARKGHIMRLNSDKGFDEVEAPDRDAQLADIFGGLGTLERV